MVYGDLLRQLIKSHSSSDSEGFREAALALIREERAKNHRLLADDLERLLVSRPNGSRHHTIRTEQLSALPRDKERDFPLVDVSRPEDSWVRLVAAPFVTTELQRVVEENKRRDVLAAAGLRPSKRLLFFGPPGCGKTLAARVIAGVLDLPLVIVRFDAVVSSYLGETAANLRRVFEFVSRGTYVVLFDEFDAIGKDRDNANEHGELKRVVNSLLQLMDSWHGESILIAATNHEQLLDSGVWRRFDLVLPFAIPTPQERVLLLRLFLRGFSSGGVQFDALARRMDGSTGADIERVCVAAARNAVLAGRGHVLSDDFLAPLKELEARPTIEGHRDEDSSERHRDEDSSGRDIAKRSRKKRV